MELWYPGAVRNPDFSQGVYAGSAMEGNCLCLHSTETMGLPGYKGGADTPHFTTLPDFKNKKIKWYQHLPINRSARALENRSGGVQTNTNGVIQIEIGGTCDSQYAQTWGGKKVNVDYIYTENMPAWYIAEFAKFVVWLDKQLPKFEIKNSAKAWKYYRKDGSTTGGSYGATSTRFTFAEWAGVYGIFGHEHVPENFHGDPGEFPCDALVAAALHLRDGTVDVPPVFIPPEPTTPPKTFNKMLPASYFRGVIGDHVTWYGQRIRLWSKELGLPDPYAVGPGPEWGPADERGTQAIQLKLWPGSSTEPGGDADGFPGMQTLNYVAADPVPDVPTAKPTTLKILSQNLWGYGGEYSSRTQAVRIPLFLPMVRGESPDVIAVQELSNQTADRIIHEGGRSKYTPLEYVDEKMDRYTRTDAGSDGRYLYIKDGIKFIAGKTILMDPMYNGDNKQAAINVLEKDGKRFSIDSFHTENQGSSDYYRIGQIKDLLKEHAAFAAKYDVPASHQFHAGDANDRGNVLRNAFGPAGFKDGALLAPAAQRINEQYKSAGVYLSTPLGERIDLICVYQKGVKVLRFKQIIDYPVSDHNGQVLTVEL